MSILCKVPGCSNSADFKVHLYDKYHSQSPNPITYHKPDRHTPHICAAHAMLNEVNAEQPSRSYGRYPFTKLWEGESGHTVYRLLTRASKLARKIWHLLPVKPGFNRGGWYQLRFAFERGDIMAEHPCSFEECHFPSTFEVWMFDTTDEVPKLEAHWLGQVCHDHAMAMVREYPIATARGRLFIFRPLLKGAMRLPKELEGRVHEFEELTGELQATLETLLKGKAKT